MNLVSSSHGGNGKQTGQEVPECPSDEDHKDKGDEKSSIEANDQREERGS